MRFRLYREYGALNSPPIFDAFEEGLKSLGHEISTSPDAIPVIWSVLWAGRMASNKVIYDQCRQNNKPIIIIEVGNFFRGKTWRIGLNHINRNGIFNNFENLDKDRPKKLGIVLQSLKENRRSEILIATQHKNSLQWEGMPPISEWVNDKIKELRTYTDRKIVVRPHPRSPLSLVSTDFVLEKPKKIEGTYDDFDIDYNYHCVINFNSGPAVQAAIYGTPIVADSSSLAFPISDSIENINDPKLKDRDNWLIELTHTEWTIEEIRSGIPQRRIIQKISQ